MMFCRDEGQGEAVLLLHGLGASSRVFDPAFATRPQGRRLLAVDLPRTGRSRRWAASEPGAIADEVVRALAARGVRRFRLFGHSFGGLVALTIATRYPEQVDGLTVASAPALGLPAQVSLMLANPFADLTVGMLGVLPTFRPALTGYLQYIWGEPSKLSRRQVAIYEEARQADGFGLGVLEALRAVSTFRLQPQVLAAATYPRRVLWGARDPLVSVRQGERLAQAIGAEFVVFEGVGHCVPDELPEATLAAMTH